MSDISSSNKRIAKNTVFLYFRMLLLLLISLYTSRVVLQVLGVDDYGIYSVVSGVIVMFSFVNGALTTGTQRHLSFELGKPNSNIGRIFTACLNAHLILAGIILLVSETVGLWFVNTQMNFPGDRMVAVNWVFQVAVFSSLLGVIKTPYEASVIAYERMDFYAYAGIIEAVLKLGMVFILKNLLCDKLIAYSLLMLLITVGILASFILFVHFKLTDVKVVKIEDKGIYRFIISFSSWTLFGAFASILETQGLNVIINLSWGVALNAAVGVASQVRSSLYHFVSGFQKAFSPQLVINESNGDSDRQIDLVYKSSRLAFFLFLLMALPLCANLPSILDVWLDKVPSYAAEICFLMLLISMFEGLSYPLYTIIFATGKIKKYQVRVALIRVCSVIIAFVFSRLPVAPFFIYVAPVCSALGLFYYRLNYLGKIKSISTREYHRNVMWPILLVIVLSVIPVVGYKLATSFSNSILLLVLETLLIVVWTGGIVYGVGLKKNEREVVHRYFVKYLVPKR